jgi:hypothetical protein
MEKVKKYLPYFLIFVILILSGLLFYYMKKSNDNLRKQMINTEEILKEERLHIEALNKKVESSQDNIKVLRDSIKTVKNKIVVKEIERIKYLPVDSNVALLDSNIKKYGEFTDTLDSYPTTLSINNGAHPIVALSENNLKDVNAIVVKYEGVIAENQLLGQIIEEDSTIIELKDSIILDKNIMLSKQDSIFNENMKALEKSIRKDKIIAGTVGGCVGAAAVAVVVLSVLLGGR